MKGIEIEEIRDALCDAFDLDGLEQMLRTKLDRKLFQMVAPDGLETVTFKLLQRAEREGWEAHLIEAAYKVRSGNRRIQTVYRKYGPALLVRYREGADDEQVRNAYRRLALAPEGYPDEAGLGGLEKEIRKGIPMLDMGLWLRRAARVEGQVCRVEIDGMGRGTGFLVGPDTVLTNYHVLQGVVTGAILPSSVIFRFDFKVLSGNVALPGVESRLAANDWLVDHSPYTDGEQHNKPDASLPTAEQLDYTLVRLAGDPGRQPAGAADAPARGWVEVSTTAHAFIEKAPLFIAQHPQARPLKLALDTDAILGPNANGTRVRYTTNTEAGSSGSPCFDASWNLVALHHYGDPAYDHPPRYNQGVPMAAIRKLLANRGKEAALGGTSV